MGGTQELSVCMHNVRLLYHQKGTTLKRDDAFPNRTYTIME